MLPTGPATMPGADPRRCPLVGVMDYYRVEGEEVHEVAVGPVHAGVIEPGHFRFQCHGEQVYHLEISLGYQHRGVEGTLAGGPNKRTIHMETWPGTLHRPCDGLLPAVEALARSPAGAGQVLSGGASNWNGWPTTPATWGPWPTTSAFCLPPAIAAGCAANSSMPGRPVCGNRFGRGLVRPGGVDFDVEAAGPPVPGTPGRRLTDLAVPLTSLEHHLGPGPFRGDRAVPRDAAPELGWWAPRPGRAAWTATSPGFPSGIYRFAQVPISTWTTGDVFARADVRWLEIQRSVAFIQGQLRRCPRARVPLRPVRPDILAVSLVEGWRGVCHVALTDDAGRFARYKVVDPSFHNWPAWPRRSATSRFPTFPCATRASTCPTAGTTCRSERFGKSDGGARVQSVVVSSFGTVSRPCHAADRRSPRTSIAGSGRPSVRPGGGRSGDRATTGAHGATTSSDTAWHPHATLGTLMASPMAP